MAQYGRALVDGIGERASRSVARRARGRLKQCAARRDGGARARHGATHGVLGFRGRFAVFCIFLYHNVL